MLTRKNKFKKRLRGLIGIALASFLMISALCIPGFAKIFDIIPEGTNVPDTDISGATGMDGTTPLGTLPQSMPDKNEGTVPQGKANGDGSMTEGTDSTNNVEKALGIVIAVIVVLAIIVLIIALIPKRERYESDRRKK